MFCAFRYVSLAVLTCYLVQPEMVEQQCFTNVAADRLLKVESGVCCLLRGTAAARFLRG